MKETNTRVVEIATFSDNDIAKQLHPNYNIRVATILGWLYNIRNGALYLTKEDFDVRWLSKKLGNTEFTSINNSKSKNVPNYWEIMKLLAADRLLADKNLLDEILLEYGKDLHNIKFVPVVRIKNGIIDEVVVNDKLRKYGGILGNLLIKIISRFMRVLDEKQIDTISDLDKKTYKNIKTELKEIIYDEAVKYSDGNILDNVSKYSNEELKDIFLK